VSREGKASLLGRVGVCVCCCVLLLCCLLASVDRSLCLLLPNAADERKKIQSADGPTFRSKSERHKIETWLGI